MRASDEVRDENELRARDDVRGEKELRTRDDVLAILDTVPDPEVPAISVVELGIVRDASVTDDGAVTVTITPTYSGCPAMFEIEADVRAALVAAGAKRVDVRTVLAPAWTTDWMSDEAKEKLRAYGIAPPGRTAGDDLVTLTRRRTTVACPFCGSTDTRLQSEFGSTACKAIHVCNACRQPFDEFKAI
ncbi:MAG TPA: 1,2-phenylacetyl-CoA epoxidase subunit PaaD [Gemmatimonadaceae bacterium]|nr:1,2-phenylacetyl-CoA epoxidase subunit PaaD [Gemmatimonadaceae bacterium]